MTPSIGRIVHYTSHGTPVRPDGSQAFTSECRAAIITEVYGSQGFDGDKPVGPWVSPTDDQLVNLTVLNPTGMFFSHAVPFHEGDTGHDHTGAEIPAKSYRGGSWHWPERVDDEHAGRR